ncbi:MAG TPA: anti-sigma factor RsbA family regulatory protein [Nocardioidaceae bacterium]|jgi:anti-sigma regulatory factor (Ser/Thr protein kinase)|nr:anti-sigma factor RsbA family regulatory protein [Nocardioidaceae bacterium]
MSTATTGTWTGERFAHEAFVFDDDEQVRRRCVPYVQEALERDEPVVVVAGERVRALLRDAFGSSTDGFAVFAAAEDSWHGASGTLAAYQDSMQPLLAAGAPWRLIGEPVWLAYAGGAAWSRFEGVANEAFADYPYYSLCLHDRRRLTPALIEGQLRTHPMVWDGSAPAPNPAYVSTAEYLRTVEPAWTETPGTARAVRISSVREAHRTIRALAEDTVPELRPDDAVLAVYELVSNALRAAGAAHVHRWDSNGAVVWQVSDDGPGMHDVAAGYTPPSREPTGGRGLWLARSLADEASVRSHGPGTAVRLYFARGAATGSGT